MQILWQDLRYGARMLWMQPGFTLIALITLALGIGANTAVFSVVNSVFLRPLPYRDSDRLMSVNEINLKGGGAMRVAPPTYLDWRTEAQSFEELAAYDEGGNMILTGPGEPESVKAATITAGYFSVLGKQPAPGRAFTAEEDRAGGKAAVVIGHDLWRRRFNADANVIGKLVMLDGKGFEVVGVAPAGFAEPGEAELWMPLLPTLGALGDGRSSRNARGNISPVKTLSASV